MSAVVAALVVGHVIIVLIVPTEGDLLAEEELFCVVACMDVLAVLFENSLESLYIISSLRRSNAECFVGGTDTGIKDCYRSAKAGVAEVPCLRSIDELSGRTHVDLVVREAEYRCLECAYAVDLIDLLDKGVFALKRETVEEECVAALYVYIDIELGLNLVGNLLLCSKDALV